MKIIRRQLWGSEIFRETFMGDRKYFTVFYGFQSVLGIIQQLCYGGVEIVLTEFLGVRIFFDGIYGGLKFFGVIWGPDIVGHY